MGYVISAILTFLIMALPAIIIIICFLIGKLLLYLIDNIKVESDELNINLINKDERHLRKYREYLEEKEKYFNKEKTEIFNREKNQNSFLDASLRIIGKSIALEQIKQFEKLYADLPKKINLSKLILKIFLIICFGILILFGLFVLYRIFSSGTNGIIIIAISFIALFILKLIFFE